MVWLGCEGRGEVMARVDKCGCGSEGSPFTTVFDALLACGPSTPAFRKFVRQELWPSCEHCDGVDCDGETGGGVLVSFFSKGSPAFGTVLFWDRTDWGAARAPC